MAIPVLDGFIQENDIRELVQAEVEKSFVGGAFAKVQSEVGAKSIDIPGWEDVDTQDYVGNDLVITDAEDNKATLILNQNKAFAKTIDEVDASQSPKQAAQLVGSVLAAGGRSIAVDEDKYLFSVLANSTNSVTSSALDVDTILDMIGDFQVKLDEQEAPTQGRALAVTARQARLLADANINLNTTTAEDATRAGFVGFYGGFSIYKTNHLKLVSETYDTLNEITIPVGTPIVIDAGVATVSGTAVLGSGVLSVNDATDEAIAIAANQVAFDSRVVVASHPEGTNFGEGINKATIVETEKGFKWLAKGLSNFGAVISQPKFVVKSDTTLA